MSLNNSLYNKPLGMIPFYIPHAGCPQQCTFCNQHRIAAYEAPAFSVDVEATIEEYIGSHRNDKYWEVAFYGGSFTALPAELQESLLQPAYEALQAGRIDGIRCSTRPDALAQEAIERLKAYGVKTVEIGVQSMDDEILKNAKRGHTAAEVVEAVARLKANGITVGIQLLPGLPGETWHTLVHTAVQIAKTEPHFGRIYPVLVIEDTELADQVKHGEYTPLTTEQAIAYSAFLKTYLESKGIYIIRTGLQSTEELDNGVALVGGPYEPAMGEMVINRQWRQRIEQFVEDFETTKEYSSTDEAKLTKQFQPIKDAGAINGCKPIKENKSITESKPAIIVKYPRSLTSKVRGLKRSNVEYFDKKYKQFRWLWEEVSSCDLSHGKGVEQDKAHKGEHIFIYIDNVKYML